MSEDIVKYNILYITSLPPSHSAGLVQAKINALQSRGHIVDCITVYDYPDKKDNVIALFDSPLSPPPSFLRQFVILPIRTVVKTCGIYRLAKTIKDFIQAEIKKNRRNKSDILFLYPDESRPPIDPQLITDRITKKYDAVVTGFWEGMLNSTSLKAIYDKLKCPIIIGTPDMAPMTGGCYYFSKCRNFYTGCGCCEALGSHNSEDQSHRNYLIKKENYSSINCAFLGNTWMNQFAVKSKLFRNIYKSEIMIDENKFSGGDRSAARQKLGVIGKFVIMVASSNQPRKGNKDIANAISHFYNNLTDEQKSDIEILLVGDNYMEELLHGLSVKITSLGRVGMGKLIECYRAGDIFINASHDDAGPSMINQAIMCGTPVVCYNNGTAIDVVENMQSGYKVETGDMYGLAEGIKVIYKMPSPKYLQLRESTRQMALLHNSSSVCIENLLNIIKIMITDQSIYYAK